jgi:hypothetical protein
VNSLSAVYAAIKRHNKRARPENGKKCVGRKGHERSVRDLLLIERHDSVAPEDNTGVSYALLQQTYSWRPIPSCPGRSVLRGEDAELDLWMEHHGRELSQANCPDPAWLWRLPGGGAVLSYRKAERRWVHTLNDDAGWRRKCASLGVHVSEGEG